MESLTAICLAIFAAAALACGSARVTPQNTDETAELSAPVQQPTVSSLVEPSAPPVESPSETAPPQPIQSVVKPRTYLEATTEACPFLDGIDGDPCAPRASRDFDDYFYGGIAVERERIIKERAKSLEAEMISRSLNTEGFLATHVPHFVVRGIFVPRSTRCDFAHLNVSNSTAIAEEELGGIPPKVSTVPWVLTCVTDFSVSEYMVGRGPEDLTLVTTAIAAGFVVRDYLDRLDEDLTDELAESGIAENTARSREGLEAILWISPPGNLAVKAWEVTGRWDVRRVGNEFHAIHHSIEWFRDTPENRSLLVYTLDDYRQKVKEAHAKLMAMHDGRIGSNEALASLMTDANDEFFEAYITAEGAYDNPEIVVPAAILLPADD